MLVPLHCINEDKCIGVKEGGGVVSHVITDLEIICLPKDLPEYIEVDMAEVNIGEGIHLTDLKLPEGSEIAAVWHGGDAAQIVATVHIPKVVVEVEDELVDEAEVEEGDVEAGDAEAGEAEATPDEGADADE